jgi:4a-hydroxytetrahydrobiopterin dehydratase
MKASIKLLTKAQLTKQLKTLDGWNHSEKAGTLQQTFTFKDHVDALVFIARVTVHAQVLDHHPDILFTFKKVKVILTTHDAKGLTALDIDFAKRIDVIQKKRG